MSDYDITEAFKQIEEELIFSMIRNMSNHRARETESGYHWSMWQAEQLRSLDRYKRENQKKYNKKFQDINRRIEKIIKTAKEKGGMEQETQILEAIKNGYKIKQHFHHSLSGEFFKLNERKLESLMKATIHDMERAEIAVLRMANDQYRKAIFNAQVYANTGAGTYEKAVDMATKDMLTAGLNCIQYKNGARHTLSDYADMAIRTASKRAYLQGEGEKRQEWGISTVIINKRGNPCPKCLPFVGKVMIDDVWSGGNEKDGNYPLLSKAIKYGLYHPRCKDSHTTYFQGISTQDDTWTKEELENIEKENKKEAQRQYAQRQKEKFERLGTYSLDKENKEKYKNKNRCWKNNEMIDKIRKDELSIQAQEYETAILYNKYGEVLLRKDGKAHEVSFTEEELNKMKDAILTHNHPLGATFSPADIAMLKLAELSEIRAVGRDGIYVLKNTKNWHKDLTTIEDIEKVYRKIQEELEPEMWEAYAEGKILDEDYNIIYQNKILEVMSERYGLDYTIERRTI